MLLTEEMLVTSSFSFMIFFADPFGISYLLITVPHPG
jgi:hypothetical protein